VSRGSFDLVAPEVEARAGLLREIARRLHDDPETALREERAAAYLSGLLEEAGFAVERGLAGLPTSFKAVLDTGRPGTSFALVAEYDALPGIGHGCGHNLIAASAATAALALARFRGSLSGRLEVFGTPAEESYGGKAAMVDAGAFTDADESVMLHPESATMVAADALACETWRLTYLGKAAHAASFPYKGVNALDALVLAFAGIGLLRQQLRDEARVHGIITKGGEAVNVIPDRCEGLVCVRSRTAGGLAEARDKVLACARGAAVQAGAELELTRDELPNLDMVNDPELTDLVEAELSRAGFDAIGRGDPFPGSSDYGNVSHALRASYAFYDLGCRGIELHSREFAEYTLSDLALERTLAAAKVLAAVAGERLGLPAASLDR